MKTNKTIINSIRFKLIAGIIIVMLPIVMYLIYNNVYSIKVVRNQVADSIGSTVNLYIDIVDQNLDSLDTYLMRLIIEENGFLPLEKAASKDPDTYQLERFRIFQKMYEDMVYYEKLEFTFVYNIDNKEMIFVPNEQKPRVDMSNWQEVKVPLNEFLQSRSLEVEFGYMWFDIKFEDDYYVMRIMRSGSQYIGMGVKIDDLLGPEHLLSLGENGRVAFTNENNEPLHDDILFKEHDVNLAYQNNDYRLTGGNEGYLIVGNSSSKGRFNLVALVPDKVILEQLPYLLRITYVIAIASLLSIAVALFALRRVVLLPIHRMLIAMRKVKEGNLDARISPYRTSNEFGTMNETFNGMVSEIQQLKIDIYEEQLMNQKAELRQLQLQINPHFFLNTLNIIYYLAMDKKSPLIQELSISLIQYFRFMFRSDMDFVSLQEEIKHTVNYLHIQAFRFPDNLSYKVDVPEELFSVSLPPLLIQTFVENSIKYAINTDGQTYIHISVEQLSKGDMFIQVMDNGPGFPEELLRSLKKNMNPMSDQGEQIGLWNVKRRLELLYKGRATINFSNRDGALVEIILPMKLGD
ncbi:sensor histidine kinase [Radiobacillus sp. PE A8.2]|uniref:sensor histidine kinase n=1 Tax=Radiobacillus sp. PE A8.2 TaxID=3380349 RepID=UPI003890C54B